MITLVADGSETAAPFDAGKSLLKDRTKSQWESCRL